MRHARLLYPVVAGLVLSWTLTTSFGPAKVFAQEDSVPLADTPTAPPTEPPTATSEPTEPPTATPEPTERADSNPRTDRSAVSDTRANSNRRRRRRRRRRK